MNAFTIKELESLSGVKAHTIRVWEQRYDFLKPQRTCTNIRYYCNDELRTLLNVALLNKYGNKISHINRMTSKEIAEKVLSLDEENAVRERIVNELVQEMAGLNIFEFEKTLNKHISAKGIEKTIIQVVFPFLEKTGILWQTGNINPAQEHLVTNIIRQKLIVAIETATSSVKLDQSFLLFLPEGEHHELGLLFMYYLIKSRGANVIYLGADVPLKDVSYLVKMKQPSIIFTHLTAPCTSFNFEKFLVTIDQSFNNVPILISGRITQLFRKKIPGSVQFVQSLEEVLEYLSLLSCYQ